MKKAMAIVIALVFAGASLADDNQSPDAEIAARIAAAQARLAQRIASRNAAQTQPSTEPTTRPIALQGPDSGANVIHASQGGGTAVTTYDPFKDETEISSGSLRVATKDRAAASWGVITAVAQFKGRALAQRFPEFRLIVVGMDSGDELILLVDGNRMKLPVTFSDVNGSAVSVDASTLRALGTAKKIEGEIGVTEFTLSNAQIAQVAALYTQACPRPDRHLVRGMTMEEACVMAGAQPRLVSTTGAFSVYQWDIHAQTGTHNVTYRDLHGIEHSETAADYAVVDTIRATFLDGKIDSVDGDDDFSNTRVKQGQIWAIQ